MSLFDDMMEELDELRERNAKLVAALRITRANNGALVAAFMLRLREENECIDPCADNQKCGCWGEMQNYIALAQQSTEKP